MPRAFSEPQIDCAVIFLFLCLFNSLFFCFAHALIHTFTYQFARRWLVPQRSNHNSQEGITFVLQNCHSGRRLFANAMKPPKKTSKKMHSSASLLKASSAKQAETGLGASLLQDNSNHGHDGENSLPEDHLWRLLPVPLDGEVDVSSGGGQKAYVLRNAASGRDLFARPPVPGEAWHVGVGAELALGHGDGLASLLRHSRESTSGDNTHPAAGGGENDTSSALLAPLHCRWLLLPQWHAAAQCGPHPAADVIDAIWGPSPTSSAAAAVTAASSSDVSMRVAGHGAEPLNEAEAQKVCQPRTMRMFYCFLRRSPSLFVLHSVPASGSINAFVPIRKTSVLFEYPI